MYALLSKSIKVQVLYLGNPNEALAYLHNNSMNVDAEVSLTAFSGPYSQVREEKYLM